MYIVNSSGMVGKLCNFQISDGIREKKMWPIKLVNWMIEFGQMRVWMASSLLSYALF